MDNTTSAEAVLWELTHLPPTTDPYLWLSNFLKEAFLPKFSSTARMQLIFIMCLLGVYVLALLSEFGQMLTRFSQQLRDTHHLLLIDSMAAEAVLAVSMAVGSITHTAKFGGRRRFGRSRNSGP